MLSDAEKRVGRRFRDDCNAYLNLMNDTEKIQFDAPHFIGVFRHACPKRGGRTTAIELRECYVLSPISDVENVPAGRFGFIFRAGHCRICGQRARSRVGRLVDGLARPPLDGRTSKELASVEHHRRREQDGLEP